MFLFVPIRNIKLKIAARSATTGRPERADGVFVKKARIKYLVLWHGFSCSNIFYKFNLYALLSVIG